MFTPDISGRYEFHRDGSSPGMQIVRVDDTGMILEGQVGQSPISGKCNSDLSIGFNDARQPGDTLYVTYYTGYVMVNSDGSVYGMAGTYQELELPRVVFEARASSLPVEPAAGAVATAVVARPPAIGLNIVHGAWYAIRLDEPLV